MINTDIFIAYILPYIEGDYYWWTPLIVFQYLTLYGSQITPLLMATNRMTSLGVPLIHEKVGDNYFLNFGSNYYSYWEKIVIVISYKNTLLFKLYLDIFLQVFAISRVKGKKLWVTDTLQLLFSYLTITKTFTYLDSNN